MHMLMLILGGLILLAVFYTVMRAALPLYLGLWFIACVVNMWIGVAQAGYTTIEELLVFVSAFGVPALAATLLARHQP